MCTDGMSAPSTQIPKTIHLSFPCRLTGVLDIASFRGHGPAWADEDAGIVSRISDFG